MAHNKKKPVLVRLAETNNIMVNAVLLTAIDNYTRHMSSLTVDEVKKSLGGAAGFFSPAGWLEASKNIQAILAENDPK
jgi:hypothetical protein